MSEPGAEQKLRNKKRVKQSQITSGDHIIIRKCFKYKEKVGTSSHLRSSRRQSTV